MPDFECSLWPDVWFGVSLTDCCIAHDLGGSDLDLAACVAGQGGIGFVILAGIMFVGVKIGRPLWEAWKYAKRRE